MTERMSFINAIANICELAGADVSQVMKGMGLDARIGAAFLSAGLGYGGSCFPKDTDSLVHTAAGLGYDFPLLRAVVEINRERAEIAGQARPQHDALRRRVARGDAEAERIDGEFRLRAQARRSGQGAERQQEAAARIFSPVHANRITPL